jgi:hypothetical protein
MSDKPRKFTAGADPEGRLTRRTFLKGLAAAGSLGGLSGCCSVSLPPPPDLGGDPLIIDSHAHIFNGRDLDIYNYQAGQVHGPLELLLPVFYAMTELLRAFAPTAEEELGRLGELLAMRAAWLKSPGRPADDAAANERFRRASRQFIEKLEADTLKARDELLKTREPRRLLSGAWSKRGLKISAEREARVMEYLPEAVRKFRSPPVMAFFEGFWHYRIVNAQRLEKLYGMASLFTVAMMDTDSWFQHRPLHPLEPSTPLAPQLDIYEKIAALTNGEVLPLLAFDPRRQADRARDVAGGEASPLEMVEDCLRRGCFIGLKLYPPMGYRPANNAERDATPNEDWWAGLGRAMDAVFDTLFQRCIKAELPVMAHANKSQHL